MHPVRKRIPKHKPEEAAERRIQMDTRNAIEVRDMSKYFKISRDKAKTLKEKLLFFRRDRQEVHEVLRDISLNIKKGETVALIGTNGSGKSTLLKLMTRIIYPNKGTVETNGKLTSLLELGAGFHPDFTGRENIYFNASIFGLTRKEIDHRIDEIIEFSELGPAIDDPIRTYSSGMYMRLAFSVAINVDAEVLLIDEILAVGDQHFQDKCFRKLEELRDSDKTIVIVTHSLEVVKTLCSRAIWIYKGELRLDGDPVYVVDEYLRKCADDQRKEREEAIKSGRHMTKGVVYVDTPRDLDSFRNEDFPLHIRGWKATDAAVPVFSIRVNGNPVEIERYERRNDVYTAYAEQFPDLDKDTIGWQAVLDRSILVPGRNTMTVELRDGERMLAQKELEFTLEDPA
jgi:ABC-type polysaccharide/polyol phosphate transport system ATPase subunit